MTKPFSMIQIGAGSMGGALLETWIRSGVIDPGRSAVIDPQPHPAVATLCEDAGLAINPEAGGDYDVAVLAVKPQMFGAVLPELRWDGMATTLFVSIAAGITADEIAMLLKGQVNEASVLRVMPTLPAKVGRGVTLLANRPGLKKEQRDLGERLMRAVGEVHWCRDEDELDRLMGVTGCAPAFFLRAVEGLMAAAVEQGASEADARAMAHETFIATALLLDEDGRDAGALRQAVTSPGGTTAAGLEVLDNRNLVGGFIEAVAAAYRRAKELS